MRHQRPMGAVGGRGLPHKRAKPELAGEKPEQVWPHGGHRPRPGAPRVAMGGSQLGVS